MYEITSDVFKKITGIGVEADTFIVSDTRIYYHYLDKKYLEQESMPLTEFYIKSLEFAEKNNIQIEKEHSFDITSFAAQAFLEKLEA